MKWPKTYATREAANKQAATLRKTYVGVLVYPTAGRFGISYADDQRRDQLPPNKRKQRK